MKTFQYPIQINQNDIDQLGHVNNVIYLLWVQQAAIAHWDSQATADMQKNYIWVVSRHEIDYLKAAYLNSKLIAHTWVGESEGPRSVRFVEIKDAETNAILAKIKTTWILLDASTKRPKRVTDELIAMFQ